MKVIVRAAAGACKCHWSLAFVFFPSPLPFPLSVHLFTDNVLFSASPDTSAFIAVTSNPPPPSHSPQLLCVSFFPSAPPATSSFCLSPRSRRLSLKVATLTETWTKKGEKTSMVGRRTASTASRQRDGPTHEGSGIVDSEFGSNPL